MKTATRLNRRGFIATTLAALATLSGAAVFWRRDTAPKRYVVLNGTNRKTRMKDVVAGDVFSFYEPDGKLVQKNCTARGNACSRYGTIAIEVDADSPGTVSIVEGLTAKGLKDWKP